MNPKTLSETQIFPLHTLFALCSIFFLEVLMPMYYSTEDGRKNTA